MITVGVDPHRTVNEAAVLDGEGHVVGRWRGPNDEGGWQALWRWVSGYGEARQYGVEGAYSYGRGLAQWLIARREQVFNVSPHLTAEGRRRARKRGKSDGQDAEAVARVVRQEGEQLPAVMDEDETSILAVLNGERELVKGEAARLQNHLRALLRQADPVYERGLRSLTTKRVLAELQSYGDGGRGGVGEARGAAIRRLGRMLEATLVHLKEIGREMEALAARRFGELTSLCGVDRLTAAQLAAEMGPGQRFANDAALASWGGVAPLEASSGANLRHR